MGHNEDEPLDDFHKRSNQDPQVPKQPGSDKLLEYLGLGRDQNLGGSFSWWQTCGKRSRGSYAVLDAGVKHVVKQQIRKLWNYSEDV